MESPRSVMLAWPVLFKFYMYHLWDGGKAAFMFWSRFYQHCGCHGNRKLPLTYVRENDVSMLTPSILIRFSSNLQERRTGIKSLTSLISDQIGLVSLELLPLE